MIINKYLIFILWIILVFVSNLFSQVTEKCGTFSTEVLSKIGMGCNRPILYPTSSPIHLLETEHFIIYYISEEIPPLNPNDHPSDITTFAYAKKLLQQQKHRGIFRLIALVGKRHPEMAVAVVDQINMIYM